MTLRAEIWNTLVTIFEIDRTLNFTTTVHWHPIKEASSSADSGPLGGVVSYKDVWLLHIEFVD